MTVLDLDFDLEDLGISAPQKRPVPSYTRMEV